MRHLTLNAFRRWLESKGEDEQVGRAMMEESCPLASFLRDGGAVWPEVRGTEYLTGIADWRPLPRWAQEFVSRVDEGREAGDTVLAADALAALGRARGEGGGG